MSVKRNSVIHSHPKKRRKSTRSDAHTVSKKSRHKKKHPTYIKSKRPIAKSKKRFRNKKWKKQAKRHLQDFSVSLGLLSILLVIISHFTCTIAKVEGYSMIPTLNHGERVFVSKLAEPKRFKLILYKDPLSNEVSVRRVIGLPGEAVRYSDDQLYVDDQEIFERFIETEVQRAKSSKSVYTTDWTPKITYVPKGKYLVLGDNRPYAADSREYGYVDSEAIVGVVEMRLLPVHKIQQF